MSWANLDDGFADHPKVIDLSDAAFRLHVCAMCWCSRRLTDGLVRSRELRILGAMLQGCPADQQLQELVTELVSARLWESCEEGFRLHDWLKHNESASKVAERREAAKQRMAEGRKNKANNLRTFAGSSREQHGERSEARSREVRVPSPLPSSPLPLQDPKTLPNGSDSARAEGEGVGSPGLPGIDPPGAQEKPRKAPRSKSATASNPELQTLAVALLGELSAAIQSVRPSARELRPIPGNLEHIAERLADGATADEVRHVIAVYAAESRHNEKSLQYFNPVSPFRRDNFARALARTVADASKPERQRAPPWRPDPSIGSNPGEHTPAKDWDSWRNR